MKKPEVSDESESDVFKCVSYLLRTCVLADILSRAPSIKAPVESNKKHVCSPVKYDSDDGKLVSGFEGDSPKEHKKLKVV